MKSQLSILAVSVAASTLLVQPANAQESKISKVRSESSYGTTVEEPQPASRQQIRKQMINDQTAYNVLRQQAMGEYAARPSARFPNFYAYQPIYQRVYVAYPYNWYSIGR